MDTGNKNLQAHPPPQSHLDLLIFSKKWFFDLQTAMNVIATVSQTNPLLVYLNSLSEMKLNMRPFSSASYCLSAALPGSPTAVDLI